jgi:hypothetical protein
MVGELINEKFYFRHSSAILFACSSKMFADNDLFEQSSLPAVV